MSDKEFSRRSLIKASAGTLGVAGLSGVSAATDTDASEEIEHGSAEQLGPADITGTELEASIETVNSERLDPVNTGIGPGSPLLMDLSGGGTALCTANYVWENTETGELYLGAAGHCFLNGDASESAGGDVDVSEYLNGVKVLTSSATGGAAQLIGGGAPPVREAVDLGEVVYARQRRGGTEVSEDFGIVKIPDSISRDVIKPSMPVWGGPIVAGDDISAGDPVVQYGNAVGFGETLATRNRSGVGGLPSSVYPEGHWTAAFPSAPGDSGSAVQIGRTTGTGLEGYKAGGILTHLIVGASTQTGPAPPTAGTTVEQCKNMADRDADISLDVLTVPAWERRQG
jgi:hypothetical protein